MVLESHLESEPRQSKELNAAAVVFVAHDHLQTWTPATPRSSHSAGTGRLYCKAVDEWCFSET